MLISDQNLLLGFPKFKEHKLLKFYMKKLVNTYKYMMYKDHEFEIWLEFQES